MLPSQPPGGLDSPAHLGAAHDPELIAILAVGATLIGLLVTFRRDARADMAEVRSDLANLRKDVQALTERTSRLEGRMSRLEGVIEGFFAGRGTRDRHDAAA